MKKKKKTETNNAIEKKIMQKLKIKKSIQLLNCVNETCVNFVPLTNTL